MSCRLIICYELSNILVAGGIVCAAVPHGMGREGLIRDDNGVPGVRECSWLGAIGFAAIQAPGHAPRAPDQVADGFPPASEGFPSTSEESPLTWEGGEAGIHHLDLACATSETSIPNVEASLPGLRFKVGSPTWSREVATL